MNMDDKQKQIEEMAKELSPYGFCKITICENCNRKKTSKCTYYSFAKRYTIKGYRKQSGTAREILQMIKDKGLFRYGGYLLHDSDFDTIGKLYGVEVEE